MSILNNLKKISPNFIKDVARKTRELIFNFFDNNSKYLNKIKYCNYNVYYTRSAALINRIRIGSTDKIYESDLVTKIVSDLSKIENPVFLDIGSNIGLISISILSKIKGVKIYAFEPSPIPFKSFFITIFANELEKNIELKNLAVSNKNDFITFSTHNSEDSSGDGILDTKRAPSLSKQISVESVTLDSFLENKKVDLIKIDIEGAELWALQGAKNIIEINKPKIYLEISLENIKHYPYSENDVLEFFEEINYTLTDDNNKIITKENITNLVKFSLSGNFLAYPKSKK